MRQRLLQHLSFAKPLRLALVLFTLLLTLPADMWAQGTKTFNFNGVTGNIIYCTDENNFNLSWTYQTFQSQYYGASTVATGVKITVRDNDGKSLLSAPDGNIYSSLVDKISINYTDLTVTGESKIYLRAVNRTDTTTHYSDPCLMTNSGTLEIDFASDEIRSENLALLIFSNDNKAYSYILSNITFTLIADYKISIAGVALTGKNVGADGSVTGVAGITGSGKVYFDSSTNTLTLDRVVINGEIESSNDNLKVYLKGYNEINVSDNTKAPFKYTGTNNTKTLTFESSEADDGELKLSGTYTTSGSTPDITISSGDYTTTNTFDQGYSYTFGDWILDSPKIYYNPHYGVIINSYETTKCNKNNITKTNSGDIYSYSPQDKALTIPLAYDGSTTDIKSQRDDLTVLISGITKIRSFTHEPSGAGTLTFKKNPSSTAAINKLTLENTGAVISGFTSVSISTPLKILTPNRTAESISSWGSSVTKAIFSDETVYDLWIGDTRVSEQNKTDVLNNTKISFTPTTGTTPNILALNTANITGMIESDLGDLTIHLTGDNFINATGTETSLIKSTNSGTLKFETDATPIGSLSFKTAADAAFADPIGGFTKVEYGNGLDYSATDSKVGLTNYQLAIGGTDITSANASGITGTGISGTVTYDPSTNTLSLTGAEITSDYNAISYSGNTLLTIALNSTNSITATYGTYTINSTGNSNIKFVKANGASNAELTLKSGNGATKTISAPDSILGSGLYWKNIAVNHLVITEDPNFVVINDYVMTDTRTINGTTAGTITYNSTDKVLTLNGFQNNFGAKHAIKTGVTGLKVKLIGESTINCAADSVVFYAFCNSASIQFIKNDETSKLTMTGKTFDKFVADNVTYDGLVYYSTNKYIAIPTAPTMDVDIDNKVVLTADYEGGTIAYKYSIDYADETADVTDATYSAPFEMAAPGTVTAWVEANGTTTLTVKGKKFGYQGAPFSMIVNDVKTPVLIPAIEAGDDIVYDSSTPYASNDASVATFENGNITAHAIGTATLTTRLGYNTNNVPATKLLNYDGQFTTQLTVSKVFNIAFAEGANYMTYYNIDAEDLTIPDGMTAAIVTGVASSGTTVETTALSYIPGRTAILLGKGTSTGTPTITLFTGTQESTTANKLKYVDNTPVATTGYEYVLYKDEFVKATGSIPDGKCYLDLTGAAPAPAPARSLGIDNDGTTDIRELRMENEERDEWYDLQGRRIEQPTKAGLYIKNGKKVIVNIK